MMLSLLNLYLATQHFGIAFSSPLRPTTLPHDELTVRAKSAQVQSGDVALVTNLEPVRVGFDDTWSYECLPVSEDTYVLTSRHPPNSNRYLGYLTYELEAVKTVHLTKVSNS